jgi:hypothetical protein
MVNIEVASCAINLLRRFHLSKIEAQENYRSAGAGILH